LRLALTHNHIHCRNGESGPSPGPYLYEEKKRLLAAYFYIKPTCDKDWIKVSQIWHASKDSNRPNRDYRNLKKKYNELAGKKIDDKTDGELVKQIQQYDKEEAKRCNVQSSASTVSVAYLLLDLFVCHPRCLLTKFVLPLN
jgi:hypothetical protein